MEDLTGLVFNDLTAICYVGSNRGQGSIWLWRCVCGREVEYPAHRIKRQHTLSCGCRRARDCKKPKPCIHCNKEHRRLNRHGNLASVCQECYNRQCNSFKERNPKIRMCQSAKIRAKKQGVPFDLKPEDFEIPEYCPVLGVKLTYGDKHNHNNAPSLDKFEPKLGYIPGNVYVISHRANWLKSNASIQELESVVVWLKATKKENNG